MHTSAMLVAHGTRHTGTARMPSATQAVERTESLLNMEGVDVKASLRGLHTLNARSNTASVPVIYLSGFCTCSFQKAEYGATPCRVAWIRTPLMSPSSGSPDHSG